MDFKLLTTTLQEIRVLAVTPLAATTAISNDNQHSHWLSPLILFDHDPRESPRLHPTRQSCCKSNGLNVVSYISNTNGHNGLTANTQNRWRY